MESELQLPRLWQGPRTPPARPSAMIDNPDRIGHPVAKVVTSLGAAGITANLSLVEWVQIISGSLAALYTAVLLSEWLWKRLFKPLALRRGWIKPSLIVLGEESQE